MGVCFIGIMSDCIFCKIVHGILPSHQIYEDDRFLAFLSLYPASKGHTLVIPKNHYDRVWDLPEDEIGGYFKVCKKIANHFADVTADKRVYSMVFGNEVAHAHVWLIPTFDGGSSDQVVGAIMELDKPMLDQADAEVLVKNLKID